MRTKSILWAAMSMTAALVMTSCSSSDDVQDWPTTTTKTIPYTVTVSQGTRATVDEDLSTLRFAEGDKLSISGTNISGVLDMTSGEGDTQATFSGNLTYTGSGDPADDLSLTATLVSAQQSGTEVTYPTDKYCATVEEAVKKYSKLTGTSTYGSQSFQLSQGTAFLNFNITLLYGVTAGDQISAVVSNNGTELCSANVTTKTENGKVVAKFVLPVADNTKLTGALVRFADKGSVRLNATVRGKVYNVNKKLGGFSINANDDRVFIAPGNLQATYNGSTWTWAFAENQWDCIGNGGGNKKLTDSEPFFSGPGTVDLFGWVGASSEWDGVNKFGITSCYSDFYANKTDGYGTGATEAMKAEWNSTNLNITNGGNYSWRTLTIDEWRYMLSTRTVIVNNMIKASYGLGNVNGVKGFIILPDGWDGSVHGGFKYGSRGDLAEEYAANTYTTTSTPTWSDMESAGCAFLPAAGYRCGASVDFANSEIYYWSSSAYPSYVSDARYVGFYSGGLNVSGNRRRYYGHSVRLVRPAE